MGFSKKLQLVTLGAPFLLAGAMMMTLFGLTSLCAENQVAEVDQHHRMDAYEQSGDYGNALKIARNIYEELLQSGLSQESEDFLEEVERIEKKFLDFGSSRRLFDEDHQPRAKLLQLLELVGMEPVSEVVHINDWAQKNLLRSGERWEKQTEEFEKFKPRIMPLLRDLGFVDAVSPHFSEYQGALVQGALFPRVRLRLHYLIEQWKQGVRFTHLYFLSGERPLEVQYENRNTFIQDEGSLLKIRKDWHEPSELPKTESEMTQLVWEQSEIPEDMREQVHVHFINAPMKKDSRNEKLFRPTTNDTVETWLSASPSHGRYLVITNAPYTNREDLAIRTIAPSEYDFDTIGSSAREQEKMVIILDELARFIFQFKQLAEN